MRIELFEHEGDLVKNMAKEYKKKTGDSYSVRFIVTMLAQKYEERLKQDLNDILNEKIRKYEEETAVNNQQK